MFIDVLPNKLLSSSRSVKNLHNPQQIKSFDIVDLQFQLCSNFFKQAKQKLYSQQAELLTNSQSLISKVQQKSSFNIKDISATQDTTTFSFQDNQEDDVFSQNCRSMLILRKSKSSACMRRTETDLSAVIKEIQRKCSEKTNQAITNLIEQNKKLKQRVSSIEKKQLKHQYFFREKQMKKKQVQYEKQQEQMCLLKKKAQDNDKIIQSLSNQINVLKIKLKQNQQQIPLKRSKSPAPDLNSAIIQIETSLKLFLHQKQMTISQSSKKLKQLYQEVQRKIQQPFAPLNDSCEKCCMMLKKIKSSIVKYRQLMEAQAQAVETLYQRFKNKIK